MDEEWTEVHAASCPRALLEGRTDEQRLQGDDPAVRILRNKAAASVISEKNVKSTTLRNGSISHLRIGRTEILQPSKTLSSRQLLSA
jgi:hypothetical protein